MLPIHVNIEGWNLTMFLRAEFMDSTSETVNVAGFFLSKITWQQKIIIQLFLSFHYS